MNDLPEQLRSFIAVPVPDSVRNQLTALQREIKPALGDVSWTRPEAMHLTLQFLGNIRSARLPELEASLRDITRGFSGFELALGGIGSFGNRVIWIGIERGKEPLEQLAEAVRSAAHSFAAHDEERGFNPHVTLGRSRRPARGLMAMLRKFSTPRLPPWTADHFELIRSELSPHGSRYTTLAAIPFS